MSTKTVPACVVARLAVALGDPTAASELVEVINEALAGGGGGGTVTSVGLTMPPGLSVANSPVTGAGTLAVTTALSGLVQASGGTLSAATVGSGLTFSGGTLSASGGSGASLSAANTFSAAPQSIDIDDDAHKGLIVKAHSPTQSANLVEIQDSLGSAHFTAGPAGHYAIGPGSIPDPDFTPYGFGQLTGPLSIDQTSTTVPPAATTNNAPLSILHTVNPAADIAAGSDFESILAVTRTDPASTHTFEAMYGTLQQVQHNAATAISTMRGNSVQVNSTAAGAVSVAECFHGELSNLAEGTMGSAYGLYAPIANYGAGSIAAAYGVYTYVYQAGSGTIINAYGIYVDYSGGTGQTNVYGIYVVDQSQTPSSGDNYNIYSGGNGKNYFGGATWIGTSAGNAASKLQIDSTTQGFLPPRMTTTQRDAIATPPEGLVIYNTSTHKLDVYNGSAWQEVTAA